MPAMPTTIGATISATVKLPVKTAAEQPTYAPSMKITPCAKLTMRMMPKMSVRPQAMKKRIAACDSALRHCARTKLANSKTSGAVGALAAVRRDLFPRIHLHQLAHRLGEALVRRDLDDEALVLALVVALSHLDRALDARHLEVLHRAHDLHRLVRPPLLDGGEENHQRLVHLAVGPVGQLVRMLPTEGVEEGPVLRGVGGDGVARAPVRPSARTYWHGRSGGQKARR